MKRSEYLEQIKRDILEWIGENEGDFKEKAKEGRDEVEEWLNDSLWCDDHVTGNGSGSYTFNSHKAKENIDGAEDVIREMVEEYDCKETAFDKWLDQDWEWFDVSIRCYLLGEAIGEALDEVEENDPNAFEESEEE